MRIIDIIAPEEAAEIVKMTTTGEITRASAKRVLVEMIRRRAGGEAYVKIISTVNPFHDAPEHRR